jgi:hypothetical protein
MPFLMNESAPSLGDIAACIVDEERADSSVLPGRGIVEQLPRILCILAQAGLILPSALALAQGHRSLSMFLSFAFGFLSLVSLKKSCEQGAAPNLHPRGT